MVPVPQLRERSGFVARGSPRRRMSGVERFLIAKACITPAPFVSFAECIARQLACQGLLRTYSIPP